MDTNYDYFDYAAATPLDERVLQVMQSYLTERFYNPSALYAPAQAVAADLQAARGKVAHWMGARPSEIIFTAGGTEANNLAIHGVMQANMAAPAHPRKARNISNAAATHVQDMRGTAVRALNMVVSAIEHEAVLQPATNYETRQVRVTQEGFVDLESLRAAIDDNTILISIMYANNEIGTIQPIREITSIVAAIRKDRRQRGVALPLYVHTDACQAANYLDLHVARLGVDLMTINSGKIYGPKQSGALYVRAGIELHPLIQGGGQEHGLRSGTENVAAYIGVAEALDMAQSMRHEETNRLQALQQQFIALLAQQLPQAVINGSLKKRLPNNIHLTVPGQDNERLLFKLESQGILAAAGSACSASSEEPSHVLRAIGLRDDEAQTSLRFTMGRATDAAAVERAVKALADAVDV